MAYGDLTLSELKARFRLVVDESSSRLAETFRIVCQFADARGGIALPVRRRRCRAPRIAQARAAAEAIAAAVAMGSATRPRPAGISPSHQAGPPAPARPAPASPATAASTMAVVRGSVACA